VRGLQIGVITTKRDANPPVKRVALKPIRRDMKPTSQSANQENPCEERLSVCLSV